MNPDYPTRVWVCGRKLVMAVNVRGVDREQLYLMPPSVTDWLPEDHFAWFVLDVIAEFDLAAFYAEFRVDGLGGAVYDPAMMLGVLVYAYCTSERCCGGSSGAWLTMSRIGCWPRISVRITPRWPGSGVAIRPRSLGCSVRCWRCV